jgi:hypothetical protein
MLRATVSICFAVCMHSFVRHVTKACADLCHHQELPGYALMPWTTRCGLNVRALGCFLGSGEFLRLVLYLLVWLLAGFNLVWWKDLHDSAAALPLLLACLWVWPWVAVARRRWIHRLLGGRWPLY